MPETHALPMSRPALSHGLLVSAAFVAGSAAAQAPSSRCEVRSGERPPAVVELYTSEGCSSCPPADRWLSGLKSQERVIAMSFHVNYWNHLGWVDPFATAETTARQYRIRESLGGRNVYTPQVVLNGRDHRGWPGQTGNDLAALPAPAPALRVVRHGQGLSADIAAHGAAGTRLAGYWAVLQDGVVNRVTRGENAGSDLRHDHVVSLYRPVPAWSGAQPHTTHISLPLNGTQRVVFVVTDETLTKPLQAVSLSCG